MVWWKKTAMALSAIGAINWGLAELGWDLVAKLLGSIPILASIVYYLIAICGIYALVKVFK